MHTIVYRVPPEFLRDKTFEKILAKRQIAWTAEGAETLAFGQHIRKRDEPVVAESLVMKAASPIERKVYALRVTDEQRGAILAELDANSDQVKKTKVPTPSIAAADKRSEAEAIEQRVRTETDGAIRSQTSEMKSGSVHPLTIVLEAPATVSAPAVPADGEEKP